MSKERGILKESEKYQEQEKTKNNNVMWGKREWAGSCGALWCEGGLWDAWGGESCRGKGTAAVYIGEGRREIQRKSERRQGRGGKWGRVGTRGFEGCESKPSYFLNGLK